MKLFRADPESGLRKAEASLAAARAKIAELEQERQTALAETDELTAVQKIDTAIAEQRAAAGILSARVQVLRAALREQQRDQLEQQRQAALAVVAKRIEDEVVLAREVEQHVRDLGNAWEKLIQWRGRILADWPRASLPLPLASDFEDLRQLRKELSVALFGAGRPNWSRQCSIPPPSPPTGVEGLSPRGLSAFVREAGSAFLARIKSQRTDIGADDERAA